MKFEWIKQFGAELIVHLVDNKNKEYHFLSQCELNRTQSVYMPTINKHL